MWEEGGFIKVAVCPNSLFIFNDIHTVHVVL